MAFSLGAEASDNGAAATVEAWAQHAGGAAAARGRGHRRELHGGGTKPTAGRRQQSGEL